MKSFELIPDLITYITKKHKEAFSLKPGINAIRSFRKNDGTREVFEILNGFRIMRLLHSDQNQLALETYCTGVSFRGNTTISAHSVMYFNNLLMINVYDHSAEFITLNGIDFAYLIKTPESELNALTNWIYDLNKEIKAQWTQPNTNVDELLEELTVGRIKQLNLDKGRRRFV